MLIQTARRRSPAEVDIFDFENRTGRRELDYVARGTTAELLRRFRSVEHVSAVAMHSARPRSLPATKGSLVLSGTVKGEGAGPFVVNLRLEDAASGKTVWACNFGEKQFKGLLELQDEISKQAVAQLRGYLKSQNPVMAALQFLEPAAGKAAEGPTHSAAAFDLYLRGSSLLQESTPESLTAANGFFERAIGEDPHFALAMAGITEANLALLNFGRDVNSQYSNKAREYALKAISEDPSLPEAHAAMAAVHQIDWNWAASEAEYDRALQLKPKFPRAIRWRAGLVLQFERFDEAIAGFEEAYRQDPYDRAAIGGYSMGLIFAGRLQDAIDFLTREIGTRDMAVARENLVVALGLLAKRSRGPLSDELFRRAFQEAGAIAAIERRSPSGLSLFSNNIKSWLYSAQGDVTSAAPYVEELEREVAAGQTSPALLAQTYVAQGRYDQALDALTQAVLQRDSSVATMRANILYSELRRRPRFEDLLRTVHLK
jgi:tetratricopeptide (TPR) repeat protein